MDREPDMLWSMGSQRVGHDWAIELNWTEYFEIKIVSLSAHSCAIVISSSGRGPCGTLKKKEKENVLYLEANLQIYDYGFQQQNPKPWSAQDHRLGRLNKNKQISAIILFTRMCAVLCLVMSYSLQPHGARQVPLCMEIFQERKLECIAMPSYRGSFPSSDQTRASHTAGGFFTIWATQEAREYWCK